MADKINKSKLAKSKALTFKEALNFVSGERGLNIGNFLEYQSKVRKAESNGDYTAIQKPRKGYKVAPGRGAYQYEIGGDGGSGSAITALNRAKQYAKNNGLTLPDDIINSDGDFSTMSPESQDMVDLFNLRQSPSGDIDAINKGDYGNVYVNHHYAGPKEERPKKLEYFNSVTANMEKAESNTEGIPLPKVAPKITMPNMMGRGIVEAQDFRSLASMALGGAPLIEPNQTRIMSKNKRNVLKLNKGDYPELPKYAGGGSPVSSPNPQPYTFNPQSVNPGSVATLQSRAQAIDTSGAVQIMQNADNLAVKNRQLDFQIEQEKARVAKLEGKERDRAESTLMASYAPSVDNMIKNLGLDSKYKRDQELISFIRQKEKELKDQQYVVLGKNKGNQRAIDAGLAQLKIDFMSNIDGNEEIRKQREINASFAAIDSRVKKSKAGEFSQSRLYNNMYSPISDYKNGKIDELPEGIFDLNLYADRSAATEKTLLNITTSLLDQTVSNKRVEKDGYEWLSVYNDMDLITPDVKDDYINSVSAVIADDPDFKSLYNIKDGEEATFADTYFNTQFGLQSARNRKQDSTPTKMRVDEKAAADEKVSQERKAAKKPKVDNYTIGKTTDEDGKDIPGLDIKVIQERVNGELTGKKTIEDSQGKTLKDAEIRGDKLYLPYNSTSSRDFLIRGGYLTDDKTPFATGDDIDELNLSKENLNLNFTKIGKGIAIDLGGYTAPVGEEGNSNADNNNTAPTFGTIDYSGEVTKTVGNGENIQGINNYEGTSALAGSTTAANWSTIQDKTYQLGAKGTGNTTSEEDESGVITTITTDVGEIDCSGAVCTIKNATAQGQEVLDKFNTGSWSFPDLATKGFEDIDLQDSVDGDIVLMDLNGDGKTQHVGIVVVNDKGERMIAESSTTYKQGTTILSYEDRVADLLTRNTKLGVKIISIDKTGKDRKVRPYRAMK